MTYPLLTVRGQVPSLCRDIARYPAMFLIDRQGRLQPAPGPDQPFDSLQGAVDTLLKSALEGKPGLPTNHVPDSFGTL